MSSDVYANALFAGLDIHDWRQFEDIELRFHRRLTVLTGANAAGKTTLLNLLAADFGWPAEFVGTPSKTRAGPLAFFTGFWKRRRPTSTPETIEVGQLTYTNDIACKLVVPEALGAAAFQVQFEHRQGIPGLFIPSHRPQAVYRQVDQLPTVLRDRGQLLELYLNEVKSRVTGAHSAYSPLYRMKEALISLALFGYGNEAVEPNADAVLIYEGFLRVLRDVLPPALGFRTLTIRMPEIVIETDTGDFSFDAASGGLVAIMDLAFQIYMRGDHGQPFAVIIDEPENHLHPELQRSLLPGFLTAFPEAQFIVATHNPLIVGSVAESNVYVLRHHEVPSVGEPFGVFGVTEYGRKVSSALLETVDKAGTSNQVLREVLGLEATIPLWVERAIEELADRYVGRDLTRDSIRELRKDLAKLGLEDVFPSALERLVEE